MEHVREELQGSARPETPFQESEHSEFYGNAICRLESGVSVRLICLFVFFFFSLVCDSVWIQSGDETGGG